MRQKTGKRRRDSATSHIVGRRPTGVQPQARGTRRRPRRSFRQEVVDLHRAIFRANQRRINESVVGYTSAFQKYEREYARSVKRYQQRAHLAELDTAIARAGIIYVGDYHTLPQAQRAFLRILRRVPSSRRVTVALEFVQGKHQRAIDAYLAGKLSDNAFLRAIDHQTHWVFGGWSSFKPIFEHCRRHGYRIIGIDTVGHGPAGTSLVSRDRYAARHIAAAIDRDPDDLVAVLVGELHLAPCHLPARVAEELARKERRAKRLILYQNCQEVYWQLEHRGLEHEVDLVRIAADQYCLMNTPPIVCQQSFLNWLDVDEDIPQIEAPEENFKEYARLIASFFDLPIGDALDEVELATVIDLSFLARLRRRGDFSARDMRQIRSQILRSESYYIPRARTVYLGNLSVNHAAEEATHFIRHECAGLP
jgi:pimeloyl-ACP methyl ester carboxylesterase